MPIAATSNPSTYAQDKLNLLDEHFAKRLAAGAGSADLRSLAQLVFGRTAPDVFKSLTVQEMATVVERIDRATRDFCSGKEEQVLIRTAASEGEPSPCFITVLRDRPFIVDTVTELFRAAAVKVRFLLHPIVQTTVGPVSVTYLQTEDLDTPSAAEELRAESYDALSGLCLATDHYPLMTAAGAEFCTRLAQAGSAEEGEAEELLKWLIGGAFVFLGLQSLGPDGHAERSLGLFDPSRERAEELRQESLRDLAQAAQARSCARFSRIRIKSQINRRTNLLLISVRTGGRALSIVGMLSSQAARAEAAGIPFIREKLARILELEGFVRNTHDYKYIVSIFNSAPRWLLLSSTLEEIREETRLIMEMEQNTKTRLISRRDDLDRFLTITVIMPRQRLSAEAGSRIRTRLERTLGTPADEVEYSMEAGDSTLMQIYFLFPADKAAHDLNLEALQIGVEQLTLTWDETLYAVLEENVGKSVARRLFAFYAAAFQERYKSAVPVQTALEDIRHLEALSAAQPIDLALLPGVSGGLELKIYKRGAGLILGSILPILENAGFIVEDESSHYLQAQETAVAAIHVLRIRTRSGKALDFEREVPNGLLGLRAVFNEVEEDDRLNALLFEAGLSSAEISILRMLLRYLLQIRAVPARASAVDAMIANPELARLLCRCFYVRFSPDIGADREELYRGLKSQFTEALRGVRLLVHDRVLRAAINVIDAVVRTNFFIAARGSAISIKIDCSRVTQMPKPRPLYEIFVSGRDLEGVHLRGGRIARGGIRWSERPDDFRTEVLGLVKTQTAKNAIIVPVGAKGGFVVKSTAGSPTRQQVEQTYRMFIRCLLQITDNRISGEIVRPQHVVCYDQPDPYFVVAADKGTASFSDIANQIAVEEFDFWLGDAFASGGSAGYDHKKLGITAKGAWEAARRHFHELGVDPEHEPFTLVGIGDMAGDVFGNGLLLCRQGRLIAAFNHSHIFIDPNPDIESSYAERTRLFDLPGSTWGDYSRSIISEGGGIYGRNEKEIPLSPQVQAALGISAASLSGPELIQAVLRAPVDLLWNGGIGTYVKSSAEAHAAVNDPLNDEVRISASELRAKIVSEGGNLGFTQQARIEFSRLGGRINTDAIDNSGGVNMSDIEVNWKILLSTPAARGAITRAERDALLAQCAAEAVFRVTERNYLQSLALSLGERRSIANLRSYAALIEHLERTRQLDRGLEQLPRSADLSDLLERGIGLTRPELAVLLAYAKMDLAEKVLASDIPESPGAEAHLFAYFPAAIAERFPDDVRGHPLHREIIAAQLANSIIERLGSTFVHRFSSGAAQPAVVLRSYLVAEKILGLTPLSLKLKPLDSPNTCAGYLTALSSLGAAAENAVRWLLELAPSEMARIEQETELYAAGFSDLCSKIEELFEGTDLTLCRQSLTQLSDQGLSPALARSVCALSYTGTLLEVCKTAFETKQNVTAVARVFSTLSADYRISTLLTMCRRIEAKDRWEEAALRAAAADVRRSFARIVRRAVEGAGSASREALRSFLKMHSRQSAEYLASAAEAEALAPTLPIVEVLATRLRSVAEAE